MNLLRAVAMRAVHVEKLLTKLLFYISQSFNLAPVVQNKKVNDDKVKQSVKKHESCPLKLRFVFFIHASLSFEES